MSNSHIKFEIGDLVLFDPSSVWANRKSHAGVIINMQRNEPRNQVCRVQFSEKDAVDMENEWSLEKNRTLDIHQDYLKLISKGIPETEIGNIESIL